MRNYFAFGSNMARATLDERGVQARLIGAGFVPDYRLAFTLPSQRWTGRAADLLHEPGHETWGVLWELAEPDALDPYEQRYDRIPICVSHAGNGTSAVAAFTYTVKAEHRADDEALPAPAYLGRMLAGARHAGLPTAYLRFLEGFAS